MKIEAWMCEYCSSIFKDEVKYTKCKAKCLKNKKAEQRHQERKENFDKLANSVRLSLENIQELPKALEKFFKINYNRAFHFTKFDVRFETKISNSHDCPIGGITNWHHQAGLPDGYPGWTGQVEGHTDIYKKPIKHPVNGDKVSSVFDFLGDRWTSLVKGINSGGGSGGDRFNFTIRLFLDDFPKIKKKYDEFLLLKEAHDKFLYIQKGLRENAIAELVNKDKGLETLKLHETILRKLLENNSKLQNKRQSDIINSEDFKALMVVPEKYHYNFEEYSKLSPQFKGR